MRRLVFVAIAFLFAFAGCRGGGTEAPHAAKREGTTEAGRIAEKARKETKSRAAQEEDIREAVFRYQFQHIGSYPQRKVKVYFLSLASSSPKCGESDKDPSDRFMGRFRDKLPRVKKVSECTAGIDIKEGVRDKGTGEPGLILRAGSIKWTNDREVEVRGGYHEHGLSASGNTYRVVREGNRWIVKKDTMNWVS